MKKQHGNRTSEARADSLQPVVKALGQSLRDERESRHLGLREAARLAELNNSELSKIELGQQDCRATTLIKLARAYGMSLDALLIDVP